MKHHKLPNNKINSLKESKDLTIGKTYTIDDDGGSGEVRVNKIEDDEVEYNRVNVPTSEGEAGWMTIKKDDNGNTVGR